MGEQARNILEVFDLVVHYPDGTHGLEGATLSVPRDARVGLIGPNGAGKTTLMLSTMGALKFEGRILVDGIELSPRTAGEVRARCGMVFQNPDDQLFMPTLLEDVAFGPLNQGLPPEEAESVSRAALDSVGLNDVSQRSGHHLSQGQKRNAALATILSMQVRLLLLDEPGAGLDFRSTRRLVDILAARKESFLLATHDLGMVRELCERVVVLDRGRVVASGPTDAILSDGALLRDHGLA